MIARFGRRGRLLVSVATGVAGALACAGPPTAAARVQTATPIKHVIVIIGENHTFDNVFATYTAPDAQHVQNLLSEGIVTASGDPGPNAAKALQDTASDTTAYQVDPQRTAPYGTLPQPNTTYVAQACDGQSGDTPDAALPWEPD